MAVRGQCACRLPRPGVQPFRSPVPGHRRRRLPAYPAKHRTPRATTYPPPNFTTPPTTCTNPIITMPAPRTTVYAEAMEAGTMPGNPCFLRWVPLRLRPRGPECLLGGNPEWRNPQNDGWRQYLAIWLALPWHRRPLQLGPALHDESAPGRPFVRRHLPHDICENGSGWVFYPVI